MTVRHVHGERVRGRAVGPETRCAHYAGDRDVIAIRFRCCGTYYPCHDCHALLADHNPERWPRASPVPAVLCGRCGAELAVETYLDAEFRCPDCGGAFNPGCAAHYDRYFAPGSEA